MRSSLNQYGSRYSSRSRLLDEHRVGAQRLPEALDRLVGEREGLRRAHGVASSVFPKAAAIATKRGSTMSHQSGWVRA